ncbi:hypothetical protein, partial [Vibrio parahaemolyticus]|uniref:hypothetical protein n=1 Tax=Vibrio parahaemolyticus TaxID=670 RepID=UPI001A8D7A0D
MPEPCAIDFKASIIPNNPPAELEPFEDPFLDVLKECFEKRPIWSRKALEAQFNARKEIYMIRRALPHVAYQFTSGPWRGLWVKF